MEGDQPGQVGGRQVGEQREGGEPDDPAPLRIVGSQRQHGADPEHGLEHHERHRDRSHHAISVAGGIVDLGEMGGARGPGRRPVGHALEAPAFHRCRALDAGEVEDGRRDVDEGHETGAARARRPQQTGFDIRVIAAR